MALFGNGQFAGILFRGVLRFPVRFGCSHLSPSLSQNPSVKCGQSSHLDMLRNLAEPAARGNAGDCPACEAPEVGSGLVSAFMVVLFLPGVPHRIVGPLLKQRDSLLACEVVA